MRDTEVLRRRLWASAGLPLATSLWLTACDDPPPQPVAKRDPVAEKDPAKNSADETGADEEGPEPAATTWIPPYDIDQIPAGEFDYYGPARDPFGPHEEEEGCPNGDWCGSPADARLFSIPGLPDQLECPAKLTAKPDVAETVDQKAKKWKGFSFHPMMQGRLMHTVTTEKRESTSDATVCCYHHFDYCSGRPLFDGETMVLAELVGGSSWQCAAEQVAAPDDRPDSWIAADLRTRLGELWVEDARMEHASIVAFARAALELQALAAPADLLAGVAEAGIDEVEHARLCFGLAARFSGRARDPGPLMPPPVRPAAWVRFALDTFVEGCVGETISTLIATRAGRVCTDPATASALEQIADDESRHAGLAWRTIAWVLEASGPERADVERALSEQATVMAQVAFDSPLPTRDPQADELAAFGRLDARAEQLARREVWSDLIGPTLEALLFPTRDLAPRILA